MVWKTSLFKLKQLLIKTYFIKNELKYKIHKSFLKNQHNHYIFRISFTINTFFFKKLHYFKSYQKSICHYSLSKKVPNHKFSYSRFFLNKKLNTFNINNVLK
jgi:hypothetical protein